MNASEDEIKKIKKREAYKIYCQKYPERKTESSRRYALNNPEKRKESKKKWYLKNKEKSYEISKKWAQNNKERYRSLVKKSRLNNIEKNRQLARISNKKIRSTPSGKINHRMSSLVRNSLKGRKNRIPWKELVGYSVDELKLHLEKQFVKKMNWENMKDWHIDHIIPLSYFKFSSYEDPNFKMAWSISNLRPLWGKDNLSKSGKRILLL